MCAAYAAIKGVQFGHPDAGLGNARTATSDGGRTVGVRAPLRETEETVVRPYWLVEDIEAAVAAVVESGGQVTVRPWRYPAAGPPRSTSKAGMTMVYGSSSCTQINTAAARQVIQAESVSPVGSTQVPSASSDPHVAAL